MAQHIAHSEKLPRSTGSCDEGPAFERWPEQLTVRYDEDGEWTMVVFTTPVAMRFTPDPSTTEFHIDAYSRICTVSDSEWLHDLRESAQSRHEGLSDELEHFMIYFDHHGCLEVIARTYTIKPG